MFLSQATTIGGMQFKPGDYQLRAVEGKMQVQIMQGDKTVAHVPCTWIQLPSKAADTKVVVNDGQVTEVDFSGRTEAIKF